MNVQTMKDHKDTFTLKHLLDANLCEQKALHNHALMCSHMYQCDNTMH